MNPLQIRRTRGTGFDRLSLPAAALCIALAGLAPAAAADPDLRSDASRKLTPAQAAAVRQPSEGRSDGKADAPPPGGPASSLPGTGREPVSSSGRKDNSATDINALPSLRADTPTVGASDKTAKPGFNQGFEGQREITQQQADRAAAGRTTNPLKGSLTDGGVVGGPLHDSAAAQQNGRGQIGRDAISDGISSPNGTFQNGELKQKGKGGIAKATGINETGVMKLVTGGRFEELDRISRGGDADGGGQPAAAAAPAAKEGTLMCRNADCSRSVTANADGSVTVHETDGSNEVIQADGSYVKTDSAGKVVETGAAASTGKPSEDAHRRPTQAEIDKRLADHNFRIKQSAKANGNITPGREGGSPIDRSAALPTHGQTGQSLFGQPPGQGVVSSSGGRSTLDFNNKNLGAVDPGRDATFTATSGPEQNRAEDALGQRVSTPPLRSPGSASSDSSEDDDEETAKAP